MHISKTVTLAAILAAASSSALAGAETVVVTATRSPQPIEVTGSSISVVTAEDLRDLQTVAVDDALETTPGLTVVRNGGPGQPASIGLRGALAGQTLVLIDGVRINDPSVTDGEALMADVLANSIDRIEVLRGPQSTLYGSDAIGGVVDIITKLGGADAFTPSAEAEGGSFDTYHVNLAARGTVDAVDYGAGVNLFHSNGISAADARNGNRETDGYGNAGATGNVRWHVSDAVSLDLRGYYTDARVDFDGYPPPAYTFQDTAQHGRNILTAGYAGLNLALMGGRLRNRVAVTRTQSNRETFDPSVGGEDFHARGTDTRVEYQGTFDLDAANQIVFGAEHERTELATESIYDYPPVPTKGHADRDGVYAQWQSLLFGALTLTGGVRHDRDGEFGGHNSVKLAAALPIGDWGTVLRGNYGDGFKAPTLYELYSAYSNPLAALAPETAHGWEAGIDQSLMDGRARASLTWFDRRTSDEIDFFSCYGVVSAACTLRAAQGGYYYNVGRARARGLEAAASAALSDALTLAANYTVMTARDETADAPLARRPHVMANAELTYKRDDWSLGLSVLYVGRRFDGAYRDNPLASHTTANLTASVDVMDGWQVFGRIENGFDARYEPVAGYGAPGRAFYLGIRTAQ